MESSQPITSWDQIEREDFGYDPLQPPTLVTAAIPPFHLHGEQNCGAHLDTAADKSSIIGQESRRSAHQVPHSLEPGPACTFCRQKIDPSKLHDIPCGAMACRCCLEALVRNVKLSIGRNQAEIRHVRAMLEDIPRRLCLESTFLKMNGLIQCQAEVKDKLNDLAGFLCCGINMQLQRFASCMSPGISRDLWLASEWLRDRLGHQRICGWPDCNAYVPACCRWLDVSNTYRYHCVTCGGNSMQCKRRLQTPQAGFPCLPQGQPALTPSM